jgi:hypothetical protein
LKVLEKRVISFKYFSVKLYDFVSKVFGIREFCRSKFFGRNEKLISYSTNFLVLHCKVIQGFGITKPFSLFLEPNT